MSNTILIVDDEESLRELISESLSSKGYNIIVAQNGLEALKCLDQQPVDLVITDIKMPIMNGLDLAKNIQSREAKPPVILMSGFVDILDSEQKQLTGVEKILSKPFSLDDLSIIIDQILNKKTPSKEIFTDLDFYKVGIEDFLFGKHIKYSIFIKLANNKYIKIAHQGEDLNLERIQLYKNKGIHYLYLKKEDFFSYVDVNINLVRAVKKNTTIPLNKKLDLVRHAGEVLQQQVFQSGLDKKAFDSSEIFLTTTIDIISDNPYGYKLLQTLNEYSDYLFSHSLGVSAYCIMMVKSMGWSLPANRFKIALAGMFHDIGFKELDPKFLNKPRIEWTLEEVKSYENHPSRGYKILSELEFIPQEVLDVVLQHHEDCLSRGFPSHLKKSSIHPMAKILAVADEFCYRTIKNPFQIKMSAQEAIEDIRTHCKDRLEKEFIESLASVFKFK